MNLIVRRGISNFENLDLDVLSQEKVYEFLFTWSPLKLVGATGSTGEPDCRLVRRGGGGDAVTQQVGAGARDTARVPLPLPAAASFSRPPPHTSTNEHGKALLERGCAGVEGTEAARTLHPAASGSPRDRPAPRAAPAPPRSPVYEASRRHTRHQSGTLH